MKKGIVVLLTLTLIAHLNAEISEPQQEIASTQENSTPATEITAQEKKNYSRFLWFLVGTATGIAVRSLSYVKSFFKDTQKEEKKSKHKHKKSHKKKHKKPDPKELAKDNCQAPPQTTQATTRASTAPKVQRADSASWVERAKERRRLLRKSLPKSAAGKKILETLIESFQIDEDVEALLELAEVEKLPEDDLLREIIEQFIALKEESLKAHGVLFTEAKAYIKKNFKEEDIESAPLSRKTKATITGSFLARNYPPKPIPTG